MRKAEATPSKLLLLPLIPALAFGIVEIASRISMPAPSVVVIEPATPKVVIVEETAPAKVVIEPPILVLEPECRGCTLSF